MPEVLRPDGKPISWLNAHKWKPTDMALWSKRTTGGKEIRGSLRTICFIDRLDRLSVKIFGEPLSILQGPYNTTVAASAGTHDFDAVFDWWINGVDPWRQQRFGRAQGGATYYRYPPRFGNHQHMLVLPPWSGKVRGDDYADGGFEVGVYVPGQLSDYYQGRDGLAGHAPDSSWRPPDIRATIFNLSKFIENREREWRAEQKN